MKLHHSKFKTLSLDEADLTHGVEKLPFEVVYLSRNCNARDMLKKEVFPNLRSLSFFSKDL